MNAPEDSQANELRSRKHKHGRSVTSVSDDLDHKACEIGSRNIYSGRGEDSNGFYRSQGILDVQSRPARVKDSRQTSWWTRSQSLWNTISSDLGLTGNDSHRSSQNYTFGKHETAENKYQKAHRQAGSQESRSSLQQDNTFASPKSFGHSAPGNGKKRRNSSDQEHLNPSEDIQTKSSLVYVHHVLPTDTLAGIAIKYDCAQTVLQRANRLWPQDTVQSKKIIFLPIAACGIRGRKVSLPLQSAANGQGLRDGLGSEVTKFANDVKNHSSAQESHDLIRSSADQTSPSYASSSAGSNAREHTIWQHESYCLIEGTDLLVELGSLPSTALGFFPPPSRRSPALAESEFSDHAATFAYGSSSIYEQVTDQCNSRAPGGVGTMGRNVRKPGPANDGLNNLVKKFANDLDAEHGHLPAQFSDLQLSGLEDMGTAIESWVRKITNKASSNIQAPLKPKKPSIEEDFIELTEDMPDISVSNPNVPHSGRRPFRAINQE